MEKKALEQVVSILERKMEYGQSYVGYQYSQIRINHHQITSYQLSKLLKNIGMNMVETIIKDMTMRI